jgi:hypothetical protein
MAVPFAPQAQQLKDTKASRRPCVRQNMVECPVVIFVRVDPG